MSDARHVTIICDASFARVCNLPSTWGWACRLISDNGYYEHAAAGKRVIASSTEAELFAVANSLHLAFKRRKEWRPSYGVLIQTDNDGVIRHLSRIARVRLPNGQWKIGRVPPMKPAIQDGINYIAWLFAFYQPPWVFVQHIKGHLGTGHPDKAQRHYVHDRVDKLAGRARRTV